MASVRKGLHTVRTRSAEESSLGSRLRFAPLSSVVDRLAAPGQVSPGPRRTAVRADTRRRSGLARSCSAAVLGCGRRDPRLWLFPLRLPPAAPVGAVPCNRWSGAGDGYAAGRGSTVLTSCPASRCGAPECGKGEGSSALAAVTPLQQRRAKPGAVGATLRRFAASPRAAWFPAAPRVRSRAGCEQSSWKSSKVQARVRPCLSGAGVRWQGPEAVAATPGHSAQDAERHAAEEGVSWAL